MKKQKYKIRMGDRFEEVEGYVFNEVWGIDKRANAYYILTYIPNGCLVESSRTMKFLKMMVQEPEFFDFDGTPNSAYKLVTAITRFRNQHGWKD
jgi:hypothetical protein